MSKLGFILVVLGPFSQQSNTVTTELLLPININPDLYCRLMWRGQQCCKGMLYVALNPGLHLCMGIANYRITICVMETVRCCHVAAITAFIFHYLKCCRNLDYNWLKGVDCCSTTAAVTVTCQRIHCCFHSNNLNRTE